MSALVLAPAVVLLALAALVLTVLALSRHGGTVDAGASGAPPSAAEATDAALPRHVVDHDRRTWSIALGAAGVVLALLVVGEGRLTPALISAVGPFGPTGLVPALAPLVVAIVHAAVSIAGERTWPGQHGRLRRAHLAARSVGSTSPRRLLLLASGWAVALVTLLVVCGVVGSGTTIAVERSTPDGVVGSAAGPFPGWPYGVPMLSLIGVLVAATWAALEVVRRRPAVDVLQPELDRELRRTSSARVLRVAQAGLGSTLAGSLLVTGLAVSSLGRGWSGTDVGPPAWGAAGTALATLALPVALVTIAALVPRRARGTVAP